MEQETLSVTLANIRAEALFHALADTEAEVEAEALYVPKPYTEFETLNQALDYTHDH